MRAFCIWKCAFLHLTPSWWGFLEFESSAHLCAQHCSLKVFFPCLEVARNWQLDVFLVSIQLCNNLTLLFFLQLLSDAFRASAWCAALSSVEDSYLQLLVPDLVNLASRLMRHFANIVEAGCDGVFGHSIFGVLVIPAEPPHVVFFLTNLMKTAKENCLGFSSLDGAVYSITYVLR